MSRFDVERAKYERELDDIAADLVAGGTAPFAAQIEAARILKQRRQIKNLADVLLAGSETDPNG